MQYQKIFVGFNGPSKPTVTHFENENSIANSWLSAALAPAELAGVLSQINFNRQILLAFVTGGPVPASGTVVVERIMQHDMSLIVYVRQGVNVKDCDATPKNVNPFVLIVIDRPSKIPAMGYDLLTFPDGCKSPKASAQQK